METIANGIHQVSTSAVNSFIIDGDEGVTLVDTLMPNRQGAVVTALEEIGRTVDDVVAIVLTHSHADHTGGAESLRRTSGAGIYASAADAPAIRGDMRPPPPPIADIVIPLKWVLRALPGAAPVVVTHVVGEGDTGALPSDLRAIDTPGHTPGHTSYLLDRGGGVLFVGDAGRATRNGDVARGWFNRKTQAIDTSLRHLAEFDFDIACFGHSAPITSGASSAFARFASQL